jgi:hypothetical protein
MRLGLITCLVASASFLAPLPAGATGLGPAGGTDGECGHNQVCVWTGHDFTGDRLIIQRRDFRRGKCYAVNVGSIKVNTPNWSALVYAGATCDGNASTYLPNGSGATVDLVPDRPGGTNSVKVVRAR